MGMVFNARDGGHRLDRIHPNHTILHVEYNSVQLKAFYGTVIDGLEEETHLDLMFTKVKNESREVAIKIMATVE